MRNFILKLFIIGLLIIGIDRIIGVVFDYLYNNSNEISTVNENYITYEMKEDIVIFGSSRAIYHYKPSIITDSLGMSCYNCGKPAVGIVYTMGKMTSILKRYTPKIVIVDLINLFDLGKGNMESDFRWLKPYFKRGNEIDLLFQKVDEKECLKLYSKSYQYNSRIFENILGNLHDPLPPLSTDNGYLPLHDIMPEFSSTIKEEDRIDGYDLQKIQLIKDLVDLVKDNKSTLLFCISPFFGDDDYEYEIVKQICEDTGTPLFNYYTSLSFQDRTLFLDVAHLNDKGADLYSRIFAHDLKDFLRMNTQNVKGN